MALPTTPTDQLYQSLYGQGESAQGGQTATGGTIKPPTTSTFQSLQTTAPKAGTASTGGTTQTSAFQQAAMAPVPNSPVTRTGAIPNPPQQLAMTSAPTQQPIVPSGVGFGSSNFTGPARDWYDKQPAAQQQKAVAVWNSWNEAQRRAFLAKTPEQKFTELQTIMSRPLQGAPAPGAGAGGGGTGGGTGATAGTSLPSISGFPVPGNAPQWQAPDQSALNTAQNRLMLSVLQNPESMNDQGVAMLQQQQMEQILAQQQAAQQQFGQQAAQRGTYGGGYTDSLNRRLSDATTGQLTQSSRDIAIQKMMQDMEDRRAALGLSDQILTGQTGRAATGHQQQLGTFGAELEKYFGGQDVLNAIRQRELQSQLGHGALAIDQRRLDESGRQFNLGHVLDWARLRSGDELGRLGLGNDLAGLQGNLQSELQRFFGF